MHTLDSQSYRDPFAYIHRSTLYLEFFFLIAFHSLISLIVHFFLFIFYLFHFLIVLHIIWFLRVWTCYNFCWRIWRFFKYNFPISFFYFIFLKFLDWSWFKTLMEAPVHHKVDYILRLFTFYSIKVLQSCWSLPHHSKKLGFNKFSWFFLSWNKWSKKCQLLTNNNRVGGKMTTFKIPQGLNWLLVYLYLLVLFIYAVFKSSVITA